MISLLTSLFFIACRASSPLGEKTSSSENSVDTAQPSEPLVLEADADEDGHYDDYDRNADDYTLSGTVLNCSTVYDINLVAEPIFSHTEIYGFAGDNYEGINFEDEGDLLLDPSEYFYKLGSGVWEFSFDTESVCHEICEGDSEEFEFTFLAQDEDRTSNTIFLPLYIYGGKEC